MAHRLHFNAYQYLLVSASGFSIRGYGCWICHIVGLDWLLENPLWVVKGRGHQSTLFITTIDISCESKYTKPVNHQARKTSCSSNLACYYSNWLCTQQSDVLCGPDKQSSALHSSSAVNVIISRRSLCNNTLVECANTTTGSKYSRR